MSIILTVISIGLTILNIYLLKQTLNNFKLILKVVNKLLDAYQNHEIETKTYQNYLLKAYNNIEGLVEVNKMLVDELNSINPHKAPDLDE